MNSPPPVPASARNTASLLSVFATPILKFTRRRPARFNAALARAILAREELDAGLGVSNVGGWHSLPDLLEWPEPEIAILRRSIREAMVPLLGLRGGTRRQATDFSLSVEAWAMVYRQGAWSRPHVHPGNHWSGIYVVSAGRKQTGGEIVFYDPRPAAAVLPVPATDLGVDLVIESHAGLMLVFPSWLVHSVTPYVGTRPRITIAFNVTVESTTATP